MAPEALLASMKKGGARATFNRAGAAQRCYGFEKRDLDRRNLEILSRAQKTARPGSGGGLFGRKRRRTAQEVRNTLFGPLQEKLHTVVLKGVINISGAL